MLDSSTKSIRHAVAKQLLTPNHTELDILGGCSNLRSLNPQVGKKEKRSQWSKKEFKVGKKTTLAQRQSLRMQIYKNNVFKATESQQSVLLVNKFFF